MADTQGIRHNLKTPMKKLLSALATWLAVAVLTACVIAMHYGTNPLARGTLPQFTEALGDWASHVIPLKPGEKVEF